MTLHSLGPDVHIVLDLEGSGGAARTCQALLACKPVGSRPLLLIRSFAGGFVCLRDDVEQIATFPSEGPLRDALEPVQIGQLFINHTKGFSADFVAWLAHRARLVAYVTHDWTGIAPEQPQPREPDTTRWLQRVQSVFDWRKYILSHPDVVNVGILTEEKAWQHWTNFGRKESREFPTLPGVDGPRWFEDGVVPYLPFDLFDVVFCQHPIVADYMAPLISPTATLHVTGLPDYFSCEGEPVDVSSAPPTLVTFGAISVIKGSLKIAELVPRLAEAGITLYIFGELYPPVTHPHIRVLPYNCVEDINALLQEHKPRGYLEVSEWPETYSFTLTLAMLTELPIFYTQKPFPSVVSSRISASAANRAHIFQEPDELIALFQGHQATSLRLVAPRISIPPELSACFSRSYFRDLVVLTAKTVCANVPYTYAGARSVYCTEQRFENLLETIASVRMYLPAACVLVVDDSELTPQQTASLTEASDFFLSRERLPDISAYTDQSKVKGMGELAQLSEVCKFISNRSLKFCHYFKLTGRYLLNSSFDADRFRGPINVMKRADVICQSNNLDVYYYTSFYKIAAKHFSRYEARVNYLLDNEAEVADSRGIEQLFFPALQEDTIVVHEPDVIGVTQRISVWNQVDDI